uniref:Uncharacterized protein n=2 Tax=viral metagenome TaxID=1070528 RepID=A0A6M3K2S4_9ZZZZ
MATYPSADTGWLLPPESAYKWPGGWEKAMRAEALGRSSYLSQMDQFYTELEEAQRQFDETMGFKWEEMERESRARWRGLDIEEEKAGAQSSYWQGLLGLENKKLTQEAESEEAALGLYEKRLDLLGEQRGSEERLLERLLGEGGGTTTQSATTKSTTPAIGENVYPEQSLRLGSSFMGGSGAGYLHGETEMTDYPYEWYY